MDLGKLSKINNDLAREMAAVPISRGKPGLFALLLQKIAEICIRRAIRLSFLGKISQDSAYRPWHNCR